MFNNDYQAIDEITAHKMQQDHPALVDIGRKIAQKRLEKDYTQKRLASMSGLSLAMVKRLERNADAPIRALYQALDALGCSGVLKEGFILADDEQTPVDLEMADDWG